MDDLGRLSEDRDSTQYANDKLEHLMNEKGLEFNFDKSNYIIINSKKN